MAELRDGVPLTELGVINRWSLAVRQSQAERSDLIAELRADLAWLEKTQAREPHRPAPADIASDGTAEVLDDEPLARPERKTAQPLRRLPRPAESTGPMAAVAAVAAVAVVAAKPVPGKAAPAKAAPTKAAPARAVVKATPVKSMPAKSMPVKSMPAKSTPAKAIPARATGTKTVPSKAAAPRGRRSE